jgi:hypothetical protein
MGWVKWLVYIVSFFIPPFGFVTFWVFSGRQNELEDVGKCSMIAAFIGAIVYIILAALGVTLFGYTWWQGMGWPR